MNEYGIIKIFFGNCFVKEIGRYRYLSLSIIMLLNFLFYSYCSNFGYEFEGNGKKSGPILNQIWNFDNNLDVMDTSKISNIEHAKIAARYNIEYTKKISNKDIIFECGNLRFTSKHLHKTATNFYKFISNKPLNTKFRLYKLKGEDSQGNVMFTGYYIPALKASRTPNNIYKYPLYRFPKSLKPPLPTRYQIDKELLLAGKGLEIAYCNDYLDVYFLHVQGSGKLLLEDGSEIWVTYHGKNNYPYKSIGKLLVERGSIPADKISLRTIRDWMEKNPDDLSLLFENQSYVFFKETTKVPLGAANTNLVPLSSVAVDTSVIPLGAILLAEVPILDSDGKLLEHRFSILFAHDTGSAIKGPGRIDIFYGYGKLAGERAGDLKHYGRVWLVLCE